MILCKSLLSTNGTRSQFKKKTNEGAKQKPSQSPFFFSSLTLSNSLHIPFLNPFKSPVKPPQACPSAPSQPPPPSLLLIFIATPSPSKESIHTPTDNLFEPPTALRPRHLVRRLIHVRLLQKIDTSKYVSSRHECAGHQCLLNHLFISRMDKTFSVAITA